MKKLSLLSLALALATTAQAAIVYTESFVTPSSFSTDHLNGQNGWTAETQTADFGGFNVVSTGLSYTGLDSSGGAIEYVRPNTGGGSVNKLATLAVSSNTALAVNGGVDIWASALIRFDADMERAFIALDFVRAQDSTGRNPIGFGFSSGSAFLGESSSANAITSGTTGGSFSVDTTHLALLRIQGGTTDLMSLWINPDLSLGEGGLGAATITRAYSVFNDGLFLSEVNSIASTASLNTNNSALFDEIRVGSSFAAVTPIPEPSSFALLAGILVGLSLLRRRR